MSLTLEKRLNGIVGVLAAVAVLIAASAFVSVWYLIAKVDELNRMALESGVSMRC